MALVPSYKKILEIFKSKQKHYKNLLLSLAYKKNKALDDLFAEAHKETFANINCLDCGNCCRTTSPLFKSGDIQRLADHLKLKPGRFIEKYLKIDEDGDYVLQESPCPFLGDDNYCAVYEARPQACRDYPHTNHRKIHRYLSLAKKNAAICPAVVDILDRIDEKIS